MVSPLQFKGEKRSRKRKIRNSEDINNNFSENGHNPLITASRIRTDDEADDSWVSADSPSDIIGPVILVLHSSSPSCITCDVGGKVFLSTVENIVDGNVQSAEPHDVRQVWVANKPAGAEGTSFKGHHGR